LAGRGEAASKASNAAPNAKLYFMTTSRSCENFGRFELIRYEFKKYAPFLFVFFLNQI